MSLAGPIHGSDPRCGVTPCAGPTKDWCDLACRAMCSGLRGSQGIRKFSTRGMAINVATVPPSNFQTHGDPCRPDLVHRPEVEYCCSREVPVQSWLCGKERKGEQEYCLKKKTLGNHV